VSDCNKVVQW